LLKKIKKINPDLILLTGDIFDDIVPVTGTKLLLNGISGSVPIYDVTGNHEYWSCNMQEIRDELGMNGVNILSNSLFKDKYKWQ
jgi:predicted MPP superfamily phosphohydrolase